MFRNSIFLDASVQSAEKSTGNFTYIGKIDRKLLIINIFGVYLQVKILQCQFVETCYLTMIQVRFQCFCPNGNKHIPNNAV